MLNRTGLNRERLSPVNLNLWNYFCKFDFAIENNYSLKLSNTLNIQLETI